MWSTWFLKSRSDLRQRWLQVAVLALMLMAGSGAIALALTVDRSTLRVINGVHEDANSAHVWLFGAPESLTRASDQPEVEQASQLFTTLSGRLVHDGEAHEASIWGLSEAPSVEPGPLSDGRWVNPNGNDEVVIGAGLARVAEIAIGDRLLLLGPNSRASSYEVVGIITPTIRVPYPQQTPAAAFISSQSMDGLIGSESTALTDSERVDIGLSFGVGVRLIAPAEVDQFVSGVSDLDASTWQEVRAEIVQESAGPPTMLRVFALFAVLASGFVVAATITNHAMSQQREIGLLKSVGLTPRQTTVLLLTQMLAITVPAAILGIVIGVIATPLFQWGVTDLLDRSAVRSVHVPTLFVVFIAVQVLVVISAFFPSRRAGRAQIVDAIAMVPRQTGGKPSLIARVTDELRLPQIIVVGVKDTFSRPMRSWMIMAAIAVAAATLMMTFSFRHSIQRLTDDPALIGSKPYELQAAILGELTAARSEETEIPAAGLTHEEAEGLIADQPNVAAFVTNRTSTAVVEGLEVLTHAIGGDVEEMGYALSDGRLFRSPTETLIGLGLAQQLELAPGDQVTVELVVGQPVTLEIVGTYFADENEGLVLMYGLDTLRAVEPSIEPGRFDIRLTDGADPTVAGASLVAASGGRLVIADLTREADANFSEGRRLVAPMTILGGGLAVLAAANLLSSLVFSVRERTPEFGMLKAIGFTPRQIVAVVMAGVAPLALIGTLIGAPVGFWLIDMLMRSQAEAHQPAGIIELPTLPWLVALVAIALAISFIGALLPALRAGRLGVTEALRSE